MVVRSPSKLTLLLVVAALVVVGLWQHSLTRVYIHQRLPFVTSKQDLIHSSSRNNDTMGAISSASIEIGEGGLPGGGKDDSGAGKQTTPTTAPEAPWGKKKENGSQLGDSDTRPDDLRAYMEDMLDWNRPTRTDHWPPFADYADKAYDPNRWEDFD